MFPCANTIAFRKAFSVGLALEQSGCRIKCRARCRGNQVELLQALQVFSGRNRQFFAGTAVHCLSIGSGLDVYRVFHDSVCRCAASDFWRSCCGMGINGMYHSVYWAAFSSCVWALWDSIWQKPIWKSSIVRTILSVKQTIEAANRVG